MLDKEIEIIYQIKNMLFEISSYFLIDFILNYLLLNLSHVFLFHLLLNHLSYYFFYCCFLQIFLLIKFNLIFILFMS